jgi:hypothetical protein
MDTNKPFAEVIESSLQGWLAQSWQWDHFPPFGSLVSIEQKPRTLIGIVHEIKTGSMDPSRYPFPYRKTEEELLKEQPQIFEFLKTTFSCLALAYYEKGSLLYIKPAQPAKIHAFVKPLEIDLTKRFFSSQQLVHSLFNQSPEQLDELLIALLHQRKQLGLSNEEYLIECMQTYSLLTGNDYRRIKLFMQRAHHVML